jgi:DNA-binding HxlR family transcriptional regulator
MIVSVTTRANAKKTSPKESSPKKDSPNETRIARRSGCPVSIALDLFGDRWSLLLVRDMMVRGYRTFREFQRSGEGIATNILADRLHRLETRGIILREAAVDDGRSTHYRLTEKGIALAPMLLEMLLWSARHEETDAPRTVIDQMEQNRAAVLAETRRRWTERDSRPMLPPFRSATSSSEETQTQEKIPRKEM